MQIKIKKLPKSLIEIEGELDATLFESYFEKALNKIGENVELPGFRKGKAPKNILLANVKEIHILEEMAELALGEHYPKIMLEEKIDAIGRPDIAITKLARNNPLGFKITVAVLPEIKLADYKKVAKDILNEDKTTDKDMVVTDEELENTIMDIRKSRAPKVHMAEAGKEGEENKITEPELPAFDDEFVKGLGPFENVADFKEKLKENLKLEKINAQKEKTRLKIIEKIIDDSSMDVPALLTNLEVDKILYRMESDITQMGLKFEDYLKHLNKTVEDLKKEFEKDGEKKAKLSLILNEIAKIEDIKADPEQVAMEVAHLIEHYKDADPERARAHAENVLTNEKIFNFLETL